MKSDNTYTEWTWISKDNMEINVKFSQRKHAILWLENLIRIPGYNKEDYTLVYRTTSPWINEQGDVIT